MFGSKGLSPPSLKVWGGAFGGRSPLILVGVVVGLIAEARLARRFFPQVAIGGGTESGAEQAAHKLLAEGAEALLSFGLAGGLDPSLRPGDILRPAQVLARGQLYSADPAGQGVLLGGSKVAVTAAEKFLLWRQTGAAAIDLESGAVARAATAAGKPFFVLRAICDPAERDLPPAALAALSQTGAIGLARVLGSLGRRPGQLPGLLHLARDAAAARRALLAQLRG